jgi:hypothetical protein
LDVLGGFDDNLAPEGGGVSEFATRPSGYMGTSVARMIYGVGNNKHSLDVDGRSYMNTYRNIGLTPSYGGEMTMSARTAIGQRGEAQIRQAVRYDPFFSLGGFSVLRADAGGELLDSNPTTAITETRSWTNDTGVSFRQRWTPRTAVQMDYGFNKRAYKDAVAFESHTHRGGVGYEHMFGRSTGVRGSYRYSDLIALDFEGRPRPVQRHAADFGFSYGRNLSRTRRVSFSGGAGAEYLDTLLDATRERFTYWVPSGYSTVQLDLGRSWTVLANYRRGISMLQGLTPRPFVTDGANLSVGGFIAPGTDATLSAASSSGQAGGQGDMAGRFMSYSVTGQVRFAVTRWWSAVFNYTRYQYRLDQSASRSLGVAPEMDRTAVRVGLSLTLPAVGGN